MKVSKTECEALVDLYKATDGPNWPSQGGWLSKPEPCEWQGIWCPYDQLWYLRLPGRGLRGSVPNSITALAQLRVLDLSRNHLAGELPAALGYLPELRTMDLSDNELEGRLLPDHGNNRRLITLDLSNNRLTGPIIPDFKNMIWLDMLDLSGNRLSGPIPAYLSNAFYAGGEDVRVRLARNQLSGPLPTAFCSLRLYEFDIAYNALSGDDLCLDGRLGEWRKTQTTPPGRLAAVSREVGAILLTWAPISYTEDGGGYEVSYAADPSGPFIVAGMTADKRADSFTVRSLAPDGTYTFRVRSFTPKHGGQQSDLWSDYVTASAAADGNVCRSAIGVDTAECEALQELYAHTNGPLWKRAAGWLRTPKVCEWEGVVCVDGHVAALRLEANGLRGWLPPSIGRLSHLRVLTAQKNLLAGQPPAEIGQLAMLETLDLSENRFRGKLPALGAMQALRGLDLSRNALTGPLPAELGSLPALNEIVLHHNAFSGAIPAELGQAGGLIVLDVSDNQLEGSLPSELGALAHLTTLDLARNRLSGNLPQAYEALAALDTLGGWRDGAGDDRGADSEQVGALRRHLRPELPASGLYCRRSAPICLSEAVGRDRRAAEIMTLTLPRTPRLLPAPIMMVALHDLPAWWWSAGRTCRRGAADARTALTNLSGETSVPRSTTSKPAPSSIMATRFLPMSCRSPFTVPMRTLPAEMPRPTRRGAA
jgi:hypothetical protein